MNKLIQERLNEWTSDKLLDQEENSSPSRPIPLVRQWAVDPRIQSPYNWIDTIKPSLYLVNIWEKYTNNIITRTTITQDNITNIRNNTERFIVSLTNMIRYYFTNKPWSQQQYESSLNYMPGMDEETVVKFTELVLKGEKFMVLTQNY